MKPYRRAAFRVFSLFFSLLVWAENASPTPVPTLMIQDSINPGTGDYVIRGIETAERQGAPFLLIQLDTPGGLLSTTRQIVQAMLNSQIPIVVFVSPQGAHAGSAGTLIALAADVAAMAPGTHIGAAHPVSGSGGTPDRVMDAKITNDTSAFAESLAKARGRNIDWAARAVRNSESIIAEEALKNNVIDLVAPDVKTLFTSLSNFRLRAKKDDKTHLPSGTFEPEMRPMSLRQKIVSFFAEPNLAYLILSLGGLCLWIELSHPGLVLPGVVGVLCILLSLVSFQMLPISYGALALMLGGLALLIAEIFIPSFGIVGVGGLIAFLFGSLFLMDGELPGYRLSVALIVATVILLGAAIVALSIVLARTRRIKPRSGLETMIGSFGEAREEVSKSPGKVFVQGELWNAISKSGESIRKGSIVVVTEVRNMLLVVANRE